MFSFREAVAKFLTEIMKPVNPMSPDDVCMIKCNCIAYICVHKHRKPILLQFSHINTYSQRTSSMPIYNKLLNSLLDYWPLILRLEIFRNFFQKSNQISKFDWIGLAQVFRKFSAHILKYKKVFYIISDNP